MRDLFLYTSGTLGLAAAFVHSLLGETRVFARARIEPERLGRLIRGVWHCSAVAWAGVAVLLIVAPWMGSQMARYSALAIVVGLACCRALMPVLSSLLAGAVDLRNRHMLFAVATALCEQHKGKVIVIAGDDDHRLENNPGCAHEGARGSGGRQRGGDLSAVERGTKGAGNAERETPKLRVPAVTAITINAREALETSIVTCL